MSFFSRSNLNIQPDYTMPRGKKPDFICTHLSFSDTIPMYYQNIE